MGARSHRAASAAVLLGVACAACESPASRGAPAPSASASARPASSATASTSRAAASSVTGVDAGVAVRGAGRQATGLVSILQSLVPSPAATANVSFFDTTYPDGSAGDGCTERATSVPACKVRACPYPPPSGHVLRPVAGLVMASVDQRKVRVPPARGWYMPRSLPGSILRGGETVRFEAAGDPSGVPSFAGQVVAPPFITLSAPNPHGTPKLTVGAPFDLAWSPTSPDGVVRVELTAVQPTMQTHVACDLDGRSGKGTIPADAMAQLTTGTLVFTVDSVSSTVVQAGAFAVTLQVSDSVVSGTAQLIAR